MRFDSLVRLIEAADFSAFRELALECLRIKGYREATITDGWSDGGTDVRVFQLPPNPTRIAIQVTVERNWKSKMREDAEKVRSKLNIDHMTFMSSRRIPEEEFHRIHDAILRDMTVEVHKLDSQSIASTFWGAGETMRVLQILKVDIDQPSALRKMTTDIRSSTAASFIFFGKETHRFREAMAESAIIAIMAQRKESVHRQTLQQEAVTLLQLPKEQTGLISSAIDRKLQAGEIYLKDDGLMLEHKLRDSVLAAQALRNHEWVNLSEKVREFLSRHVPSCHVEESVVEEVVEDLGALLMQTAKLTSEALVLRTGISLVRNSIETRLRHLNASLDSIGFPEGGPRDAALEELASLASNSDIGKQIIAGELFLSISAAQTPHLIQALGARSGIEVFFDSSVAIPMLCGLLYEPVAYRRGFTAHNVYNQLIAHDISMRISDLHTEEVATHLLLAARGYQEIVETNLDEDLTGSNNAFVAHYTSLRLKGKVGNFREYLAGFGCTPSIMCDDIKSARDKLKRILETMFSRYQIEKRIIANVRQDAYNNAQREVEIVLYSLDIDREKVLQRNDACIIAYLNESEQTVEQAQVLCTWDRMHFEVRKRLDVSWIALNPAALGDILSLASAGDEIGPITSPVAIAKSMTEKATAMGASVWDVIAVIEQGKLHDATLLSQAQEFKRSYIEDRHRGFEFTDIAKAWEVWKQQKMQIDEPQKPQND